MRTHAANATQAATLAALKSETGALPNQSLKQERRRRRPKFSKVEVRVAEVVRPAVEPWVCDECENEGDDFLDLQDHVSLTGHTVFTAR